MNQVREMSFGIDEGDPLPPQDRLPPPATRRLDIIYREHGPRLLRFLSRRTTREAAEDLTQQAFVRLASLGRKALDKLESPVDYLHRTGLNLLADEARAAARHAGPAHVPVEEVEIVGPDQIAALEARDMLARLEAAMLRLKPRTREIFLAHRLDGYSYSEISGRTGLGVKAVEKHMSLAIAQLDRHLTRR